MKENLNEGNRVKLRPTPDMVDKYTLGIFSGNTGIITKIVNQNTDSEYPPMFGIKLDNGLEIACLKQHLRPIE